MQAVERGVILDDVRELLQQGLDAGEISLEVGCSHQIPVQLFVSRTRTQPLPRGPSSAFGVASLQAKTRELMSSRGDLVLEADHEAFDVRPVEATPCDLERSAANQFQRRSQ